MTLALAAALAACGDWVTMGGVERLGALAMLVLGGGAVYSATCYLCGLRLDELRLRVAA
jgi:hypothetical protein